ISTMLAVVVGFCFMLAFKGTEHPSSTTKLSGSSITHQSPLDVLSAVTLPAGIQMEGVAPPLMAVLGEPRDPEGDKETGANVAFNSTGSLVGCRSDPLVFRIWATATRLEWLALKGDERAVRDIIFARSSQRVAATGGMDRTVCVRLWDLATDGSVRERPPL